jgi:hypothetical protein
MRFLRHDGIYRSDVSLFLVNPAQMPPPDGRPRCRAIVRDGRITPCPSSAMSSDRLFLDRGGRHQSPSPLRRHPQNNSLEFRLARNYHRTAGSVLTVCVSRWDKRTLCWYPDRYRGSQAAHQCRRRWLVRFRSSVTARRTERRAEQLQRMNRRPSSRESDLIQVMMLNQARGAL